MDEKAITFFTVEDATKFYIENGGKGTITQVIRAHDTGTDEAAWLVRIDKPANPANEVVFERHTFTKPHASLLQIVRRHDGSLGVLCRKRNVFDEFREFRGDNQFEQIQDWLDELIEDHDEIVGEALIGQLERRYGPNWQERPELWKRGEH